MDPASLPVNRRARRSPGAEPDGLADAEAILPRVVDRYAGLVANLETVSLKEVTRARNILKALVGSEIRLVPTEAGASTPS